MAFLQYINAQLYIAELSMKFVNICKVTIFSQVS